MKRFVIERAIPGIGGKTSGEYCAIAATSNRALAALAPKVQWEHSYIVGDKTFCIYLADDPAAILRHAELSGFPATIITEVATIIDPTTAG